MQKVLFVGKYQNKYGTDTGLVGIPKKDRRY